MQSKTEQVTKYLAPWNPPMAKLKEEVSCISFKSSSIPVCFPEQILVYRHKDIILEVASLTKNWELCLWLPSRKTGNWAFSCTLWLETLTFWLWALIFSYLRSSSALGENVKLLCSSWRAWLVLHSKSSKGALITSRTHRGLSFRFSRACVWVLSCLCAQAREVMELWKENSGFPPSSYCCWAPEP